LRVQDELNAYHRRSSHEGTSLDSSSIYALLSFDSTPENRGRDSVKSDLVDRLKPATFGKDGNRIGDSVKYRHKKESSNETERTSVTSLVSAVPNHYTDSLSSTVGRRQQLVVSAPDANVSKCAESGNSSVRHLSDENEACMCNGLMSLHSADDDDDDAVLSASSKNTSLPSDAAAAVAQCPAEISRRRYSCGDQLAATWWRLLDRASSFSDLRVLPRSLSRLCCSTWRTFTGVKSQCIDVSKIGNVGPLQLGEASQLNVSGTSACAGDEVADESMSQWWHKSVSPDRKRLIDISSDAENSSLCEDSPRKLNCKRASLDSAQNTACETVAELSDSDSGGSYVSLRVNCKPTAYHKTAVCDDNVPNLCHTDCDTADDGDTLFSVVELPVERSRQELNLRQAGDEQEPLSTASVYSGGSLVPDITQGFSSSPICSSVAVQPAHCSPIVMPCPSVTRSLSCRSCSVNPSDQILQSNSGYVNLCLGLPASTAFLSNCSSPIHAHPAEVSSESKTVPNLGSDSITLLDNLAVHRPCSPGNERLSCDNSKSSDEFLTDKFSRKSSNRLLRLIRRGSAKAHKQATLAATTSRVVAECDSNIAEPTDFITVSVSSANDESPNVHRLPSPNVPPPPVPDDSATSRLFQLNHTSVSEHLPMNVVSADSDTLSPYEDLSVIRSSAVRKCASLSSSYSAGDRRYYDSHPLKCGTAEMYSGSSKLSARIPAHRHGHGRFSFAITSLINIFDGTLAISLQRYYGILPSRYIY